MRKCKYDREKCIPVIIDAIARGEGLKPTCDADKSLPSHSRFLAWVKEDDKLADSYAHARESQAQIRADEIISVADDPNIDPNDKRIMVDARKFIAMKLLPKVYGDRPATVTIDARQQTVQVFDRSGMLEALADPDFRTRVLNAPVIESKKSDPGSNGKA